MPFDLFGMQRGQQPFDELTQMDAYQPQEFMTGPVGQPNQPVYPSKRNYDPFAELGPYPQAPQEKQASFLEMIAFARPNSILGTLGRGEAMKRQMQQQEYQRRVKEYEDKQQMLLQRAQYESLRAQRDVTNQHYYGSPQTVTRGGKPQIVTRPEDIQATDQPYQAPKQDMSVQPYEDFRKDFQAQFPSGRNRKGQSVAQAWKEMDKQIAAEYRQPPQPKTPQWKPYEVEDPETGEVATTWYNATEGPPKAIPQGLKPHKTGVAKPDSMDSEIEKQWFAESTDPKSSGGVAVTVKEREKLGVAKKTAREARGMAGTAKPKAAPKGWYFNPKTRQLEPRNK